MMARLMIDSAAVWARDYRIDGFRFDLMGHQPKAAMLQLQVEVDAAAGRRIPIIGEGWNFGEVADGARFVQASQLSLPGSGIATFSDRARDALRGGGAGTSGAELRTARGWLNRWDSHVGDAEAKQAPAPADAAAAANPPTSTPQSQIPSSRSTADLVRVGLAGSVRAFELQTADGGTRRLEQIDYAGQPAGYVTSPEEVVNYVENHDNQTLFDINVLRLPDDTAAEERARVQLLAAAVNLLSQGVPYFHAGIEVLRSKSLDRNSYDSGDHFNRLDYSGADNGFGRGLPPAWDNEADWPLLQPLLAREDIRPSVELVDFTRRAFLDLLRIRAQTPLLRLRSADDIQRRLRFLNAGPDQIDGVIVVQIDGSELEGSTHAAVLYAVNADVREHQLPLPGLSAGDWRLHPVQANANAADKRPKAARLDTRRGLLSLPARTAVVFVRD
jgi:pullulanase-type alpha-1,6-glucosidase